MLHRQSTVPLPRTGGQNSPVHRESQIEAIRYLTEMKVSGIRWSCSIWMNTLTLRKHIKSHKYLKERFIQVVNPKKAYLVNGEGNVEENIATLTEELEKAPIDVALVGIGENAHIAFNDPPADFETDKAYIIVNLDQTCKQQQVNEGWFGSLDEVPAQAISMTVPQILKSRTIVTIVPGIRKSDAIQKTLSAETVTNLVPATILKTHPDWNLFLDGDSASKAIPQV